MDTLPMDDAVRPMEYVGEPDWASAAVHGPGYSGETPLVNRKCFQKGSDATSWHVYSVDWTASSLLFRIDGELAYRVSRRMVDWVKVIKI